MKAKYYVRSIVMLVFMAGILLGGAGCAVLEDYRPPNTGYSARSFSLIGPAFSPSVQSSQPPVIVQQFVGQSPQPAYQQQFQPAPMAQPGQPTGYIKVYRDAAGKLWTKDPTTGKYVPYTVPPPQ